MFKIVRKRGWDDLLGRVTISELGASNVARELSSLRYAVDSEILAITGESRAPIVGKKKVRRKK